MSHCTAELIEIPNCDWTELRDLFVVNWPEHILGYSIVNNFLEWNNKCEKSSGIRNLKFFSLDGTWRSDGTFLVIDRYQLFLYSLTADAAEDDQVSPPSRLEIALGLLDWSRGFKVSSFSSKHRRSVVRVVESKGLIREFDSETIFYHLPKEKAELLPMDVPSDVILKPLLDSDIPLAESLWPNRHSGSLFFLRRVRKWNTNIGAYRQLSNGSEVLMGWCFILQSGALGALQVREEFQGQGIGRLVTVAMAKLLMKENKDSFGYVGPQNLSSRRIFERLDYQDIGIIYWLRTFPVGKTESIWEGDLEEDL